MNKVDYNGVHIGKPMRCMSFFLLLATSGTFFPVSFYELICI